MGARPAGVRSESDFYKALEESQRRLDREQPTPSKAHQDALCRSKGHEFNPDVTEFRSGWLLSVCTRCSDRLEIPWIPGGTAARHAKWLAGGLLGHETPNPSDFELIDEELEKLDRDQELIEDARASLSLARRVLLARLKSDG